MGGEHFRELATMLRQVTRACSFAGARKELSNLAASFDRSPDHLDRRSRTFGTRGRITVEQDHPLFRDDRHLVDRDILAALAVSGPVANPKFTTSNGEL